MTYQTNLKFNFEEASSYNHHYIQLDHGIYHYIDQNPKETQTLIFLHGFPESWFFWKYQLNYFIKRGYRTIAFSMPGYGETKIKNDLKYYSHSSIAKDIQTILVNKLNLLQFIIVGHDWGSVIAWELAYQYPKYIEKVISISVPYAPPQRAYSTLREKAKAFPALGYQVALDEANNKELDQNISKFLKAFLGLNIHFGINEELIIPLNRTLLEHINLIDYNKVIYPDEKMMNHLVDYYHIQGTEGPCNWYRVSKINHDQNRLKKHFDIHVKSLMILGELDFLTKLEKFSKPFVKDLTIEYIKGGGHWIQYTHHETLNQKIFKFIQKDKKISKL